MISKAELEHAAYYEGKCRNATIARWDATQQRFVHWRTKFNITFLETICHPEDDQVYDVFVPAKLIMTPHKEIPLQECR